MARGPTINGKQYALVILRVLEWDEQGRPSKCVIGYDDTTFDLTDDKVSREFYTAFVPESACKSMTRSN